MQLDFERIRIMKEVYDDSAGYQQIIRRAMFLAELLDRKKIYIDDNLFVGSLAGSLNAIYTHPEWNVEWMKEEHTVENSANRGRPRGQRLGARLLGQTLPEDPYGRDLPKEVRIQFTPRYRVHAYLLVP